VSFPASLFELYNTGNPQRAKIAGSQEAGLPGLLATVSKVGKTWWGRFEPGNQQEPLQTDGQSGAA